MGPIHLSIGLVILRIRRCVVICARIGQKLGVRHVFNRSKETVGWRSGGARLEPETDAGRARRRRSLRAPARLSFEFAFVFDGQGEISDVE
jgi:hypothetical protein